MVSSRGALAETLRHLLRRGGLQNTLRVELQRAVGAGRCQPTRLGVRDHRRCGGLLRRQLRPRITIFPARSHIRRCHHTWRPSGRTDTRRVGSGKTDLETLPTATSGPRSPTRKVDLQHPAEELVWIPAQARLGPQDERDARQRRRTQPRRDVVTDQSARRFLCAQRVRGRRDTAGHGRARRDTDHGPTWDFETLAGTRRHPGARGDGFTRRMRCQLRHAGRPSHGTRLVPRDRGRDGYVASGQGRPGRPAMTKPLVSRSVPLRDPSGASPSGAGHRPAGAGPAWAAKQRRDRVEFAPEPVVQWS